MASQVMHIWPESVILSIFTENILQAKQIYRVNIDVFAKDDNCRF